MIEDKKAFVEDNSKNLNEENGELMNSTIFIAPFFMLLKVH